MRIEDGSGSGYSAKVSSEKKLAVSAVSIPIQMHISAVKGQAFQVSSEIQAITGEYGILALQNNTTLNMVITYIRIGCDKTEVAQMLIEQFLGGNWVDGTALTPTNLNRRFSLESGIKAHTNSIPEGLPFNIDVAWIKGPDERNYNKQGSIILPTNAIYSIRVTPETASVPVHARVSFLMLSDEQLSSI